MRIWVNFIVKLAEYGRSGEKRVMRELGCSSITFREVDIRTAIEKISAHGFKVMDLGIISGFCPHLNPLKASEEDYREIVSLIKEKDLRVCTLNVHSGVAFNDPLGSQFQVEYVKKCLNLAAMLECYALSVPAGWRVRDGKRWAQDAKLVAPEVEKLGDFARNLGVELTLEVPHHDSLAESFDEARNLMEIIDPYKVGVTLDTSHVAISGVSLSDAVRTFGKRIRHVHLRDAQDDNFLLAPGDGSIDFKSFFSQMAELGYDREYVLELEFEGITPEQVDRKLNEAKRFISELLSQTF